jgi:hypothetical protein
VQQRVARLVKASFVDIPGIGVAISPALPIEIFGLFLFLLGAGAGAVVTYVWLGFEVSRLEHKLARLQSELRANRENDSGKGH